MVMITTNPDITPPRTKNILRQSRKRETISLRLGKTDPRLQALDDLHGRRHPLERPSQVGFERINLLVRKCYLASSHILLLIDRQSDDLVLITRYPN